MRQGQRDKDQLWSARRGTAATNRRDRRSESEGAAIPHALGEPRAQLLGVHGLGGDFERHDIIVLSERGEHVGPFPLDRTLGFSPARRVATGISCSSNVSGERNRFWYS